MNPGLEVRRLDVQATPAEIARISWGGAFVIFCRYTTVDWLRAIRSRSCELAGVGLFIDDDLEALAHARASSLSYKLKLRRLALWRWPTLLPMLSTVWVSTPVLAALWSAMSPRLLPPIADTFDLRSAPVMNSQLLVGLHATASHASDQRWLEPVVRGVLSIDADIHFEIVADYANARRWRGDPRVRVVKQQPWPAYRIDTATHGRHLLLAPTLQTQPNAARAPVKRIDAARCGAALLVSDALVYGVSRLEAELGMIAPLDHVIWIEAIRSLIRHDQRRLSLAALNREALLSARAAVVPLFETLDGGRGDYWRLAE